MCFPGAKAPYTPQTPFQPNQGQVLAQQTRESGNALGVASTILTSPSGMVPAAPMAMKTLIGQ